jgi:mannan endo-1,4-beta-mannosidase
VEIDLLGEMSCDPAAFTDVRRIYLWISPGQFDIDHLRAE